MSTRHLRKVSGKDGILKDNQEDYSDNDVSIISDKKPKQFNMFNLLNEDSENDVEEEEEKEENLDEEETLVTVKPKKRKKKKKRKKERKYDETTKEESQEDSIDEIERSVREVNKLLGEPVPSSSRISELPPISTRETIMAVDPKFLNPQNELKRICGGKIPTGEQNKSRARGRAIQFRKTWLTGVSHRFPGGKTGLSMILDQTTRTEPGVHYFVYVHSPAYRSIQEKFHMAVENSNPELLVNLINANPYHVDSLLQFADVCKFNEDLQLAAELVEQAVHSLECAFHPSFNMTTGNCRLNYQLQANRALFLALFKHLSFIGARACYRTSLELSKFLFSLDPVGDPMAIVLIIDLYALRAREYEWLINFCGLWNDERNLTQLPNIAYSLALAHFRLGNKQKAGELLQEALLMFPGVLLSLLDKCGVSTDTRVLGHDFFGIKAKSTTSQALEMLQTLYITRSYHLWKEADILPFLESNVNAVMDRIDNGDEYAKFCEMKRSKRYQGKPPRNILRHFLLCDFKDSSFNDVRRHHGDIYSYDPYPPIDSIDIYPRPGSRPPITNQDPMNMNLFSLFVSSLFSDLERVVPNGGRRFNQAADQLPPEEFD